MCPCVCVRERVSDYCLHTLQVRKLVQKTCQVMQPFLKDAILEMHGGSEKGAGGLKGQCVHLLGFDVMFDETSNAHLLEVNCMPRLGMDGIEVIGAGVGGESARAGRDVCTCMDDYRPHVHYDDPVDVAAKSVAIGGALLLLKGVGSRKVSAWRRHLCGAMPGLVQRLVAVYEKVCACEDGAETETSGDENLLMRVQELYMSVGGSRRKVSPFRRSICLSVTVSCPEEYYQYLLVAIIH